MLEYIIEERPQADRILVAQLTGEARFRAKWRALTADEEHAGADALREIAGGRTDLLAEVAGLLEGASEGELDEPLARQAAVLCWLAGADAETVPAWVEEGCRRRDAARLPPHSGGVREARLTWSSEVRHRVTLGSTVLAVSSVKVRLTAVIMDVLDVITSSPSDDPAWGLWLCEATGYGTGTIYPALDRLLKAGWITDHWEDPAPEDRPRRRFYEMTSTGREQYGAGLRARRERRATWSQPASGRAASA
jgi:DNA-binding MarR family transcriptional regulator